MHVIRHTLVTALMIALCASQVNAEESGFELPTVDNLVAPVVSYSSQQRVLVDDFIFTGNTVVSTETLREIALPYTQRSLSSEQLEALRQEITQYYVRLGYINSGAQIPDQDVDGNTIRIHIIEGRLADIRITGNDALSQSYIAQRLAFQPNEILNVNVLQQRVQYMLQSPMIDRINANLVPGSRPGEADLLASVDESRRFDATLGISNHLSPEVGTFRESLSASVYSLAGIADEFRGSFAFFDGLKNYANGRSESADNLDSFAFSYSLPILANNTRLETFLEYGNTALLMKNDMEFSSENRGGGARLVVPLGWTRTNSLQLSMGLDYRFSKTALEGEGIPIDVGVSPNGESAVLGGRVNLDWVMRSMTRVFAARFTLNSGVDSYGAVEANKTPSRLFYSLAGQAQFAQRLTRLGDQLIFRLNGQYTHRPLLPLEKFSIGGRSSVRGYREGLYLRDNGAVASVEYQIPTPVTFDGFGNRRLQVSAYADAGGVFYADGTLLGDELDTIASVGLGLRWEILRGLNTELFWAKSLITPLITTGESLQDSGVHFSVAFTL
ncbi:MAG: BamA/TamA family outer membrane protein [Gammaproteobacteria bacterium]|nr:BamA/TamA family outer membrane protein [Gammaproteobacteria bacterium]